MALAASRIVMIAALMGVLAACASGTAGAPTVGPEASTQEALPEQPSQATPSPSDAAPSVTPIIELWTGDDRRFARVEGLPTFVAFNGLLGISSGGELLHVSRGTSGYVTTAVELPTVPSKVTSVGVIGADGLLYMPSGYAQGQASCDTGECTLEPVVGISGVVDASACHAVTDAGAAWVLTEACAEQYTSPPNGSFPAPVQGISNVTSVSPAVIPGVASALTADGSAYAWGELSKWLPGCPDGPTPVKLNGAPKLARIQGLYGTDETGQMWTWIGVGRCSEAVASGAAKVVGPRDANVSPIGYFFSVDGTLWSIKDEFDTYTPTAGQAPALSPVDPSVFGTGFKDQHVLMAFKNGVTLVLASG